MPSEETIVQCCLVGDVGQLLRWARQGVRVVAVEPLLYAAAHGLLEVVRVLLKELGADVNQARDDGGTPLYLAAQEGKMSVVQCLVKEFGANVNQAVDGTTPLCIASVQGHVAVCDCLVKECGADINQADKKGYTPLYLAAQDGRLAVVRCLVKECGADINQAANDGCTPLITASAHKQTDVVVWLIKHGADAQAPAPAYGTAEDVSRHEGAPAEQTAYLEARTHCANPGCDGAGLKKCAGCLKVFFCGPACIRAHWPAHKAECKRLNAELKAGL
jgi:ankyrin repeat protein